MCTSFCISPSSSLDTGMPVHLETTAAMSSASTSSLSILLVLLELGQLRGSASSSSFSQAGQRAVLQLGGPVQVGRCARPSAISPWVFSILLLDRRGWPRWRPSPAPSGP